MPDIFGRETRDYRLLMAMEDQGILEQHFQHLTARGRAHNFDALPDSRNPVRVPLNDDEANAQAIQFVTNNMQAIQSMIEEIIYTDFRLDDFFPIITTIPEGARTYSYRVINKYGRGKFITNDGSDANRAEASMQNVPYSLEYGGIIPSWTLEDIRAAAFAGIALDTETIKAGTEGCLDHIEIVGLAGDSSLGFTGLINDANIPADSALKTIANMTADERVAFIQENVAAVVTQTAEVAGRVIRDGFTVYLPIAQEALIADTKYSNDAAKTIWEYVSVNNMFTRRSGNPLKLAAVSELAGAGAGDTDRALFGFNNDRVMEMAMPIQPRIVKMLERHYGIDAPMEYKISGLNVKRPEAMRYIDEI